MPRTDADRLAFRVRFLRAADTRWRYLVHSRMTTLARGPRTPPPPAGAGNGCSA